MEYILQGSDRFIAIPLLESVRNVANCIKDPLLRKGSNERSMYACRLMFSNLTARENA